MKKTVFLSGSSLFAVNLNSMIGAGIFVYPALIAAGAKGLGFLSYAVVFCIMLPLVLSIAQLAVLHPACEGGLYVYAREVLGNCSGVVFSLIYVLAKAISCSIMIRIVALNFCSVVPFCLIVPMRFLLLLILLLLLVFNLFGVRLGLSIQLGFFVCKVLPILTVVIGGLFIFNVSYIGSLPLSCGEFVSTLPLAFYPMLGFEMCCALGHMAGSGKRLARTVVGSFILVTVLYMVMQFMLFAGIGASIIGSLTPIALFFKVLFTHSNANFISLLGVVAIVVSAAGAAYSTLYAMSWYPFAIGKFFKVPWLTYKNCHGAPIASLLLHFFVIALLLLAPYNIGVLGKISVLGCLVMYAAMTCALLKMYSKRMSEIRLPYVVVLLSLASCIYIGYACVKDFF